MSNHWIARESKTKNGYKWGREGGQRKREWTMKESARNIVWCCKIRVSFPFSCEMFEPFAFERCNWNCYCDCYCFLDDHVNSIGLRFSPALQLFRSSSVCVCLSPAYFVWAYVPPLYWDTIKSTMNRKKLKKRFTPRGKGEREEQKNGECLR